MIVLKDVYYRLLTNASYNWKTIISIFFEDFITLQKVQDAKLIESLYLDDTVENKVGKI